MRELEEYSFNLAEGTPEAEVGRESMNKNYRVGKIKFFAKAIMNPPTGKPIPAAVMLKVIEFCGVRWSAYHLWISVDDKFDITSAVVGQWAEVGFYIKGAFRDSATGRTSTELRMRHFQVIDEIGVQCEITIGDPDQITEDDMMSVPKNVIDVAKEIYFGTQYTPVRTEDSL